jgi:hypothetical protein
MTCASNSKAALVLAARSSSVSLTWVRFTFQPRRGFSPGLAAGASVFRPLPDWGWTHEPTEWKQYVGGS